VNACPAAPRALAVGESRPTDRNVDTRCCRNARRPASADFSAKPPYRGDKKPAPHGKTAGYAKSPRATADRKPAATPPRRAARSRRSSRAWRSAAGISCRDRKKHR
jgi:hypothetical protein